MLNCNLYENWQIHQNTSTYALKDHDRLRRQSWIILIKSSSATSGDDLWEQLPPSIHIKVLYSIMNLIIHQTCKRLTLHSSYHRPTSWHLSSMTWVTFIATKNDNLCPFLHCRIEKTKEDFRWIIQKRKVFISWMCPFVFSSSLLNMSLEMIIGGS